MNLGKSVYNLLKRQTEVYVKGLGSFKRNHTSSTFDEKKNVYLPPINYIDFDKAGLQGYDFIQYIQQLNELDRADAERLVQDGVEAIQLKIAEDGQVKLDDLGYLVRYGEGYVFKPLDLSGFNFEPTAVWADDTPQAAAPVENQEEELQVEAPLVEPEVVSELVVADEAEEAETTPTTAEEAEVHEEVLEPTPVIPAVGAIEEVSALASSGTEQFIQEEVVAETEEVVAETEEVLAETEAEVVGGNTLAEEVLGGTLQEEPILAEDPQAQKKGSKAIWYILLVIIALGVMISLYLANRPMKMPNLPTIADSIPVMQDSVDSVSLLLPVDSLQQDSLAVAPVALDTVAVPAEPEKVTVKHPKHEWQIVIGSHKTLAQAYEQAESYNKAGHPKVRVVPSNLAKNRKKVIWDSYETKEQADSATLYVQKHIIKDAWPDRINK